MKLEIETEKLDGWMLFLLGQDRPTGPAPGENWSLETMTADMWDMASETPCVAQVRQVIEAEIKLGRMSVTAPAGPARP